MGRRVHSGFTLIETVISLVLLSFIALIGYQGLAFGMEQWRKGHERLEFGYAYQQAMGWIRSTVGTPEKIIDRRENRRSYLFDGSPRSVEFVTRFDRIRRGGLYVTRLFHDPRESSLKVGYILYHPEIDPWAGHSTPDQVTILDDVVELRLAYYGKKSGPSATWHQTWGNLSRLPRLIRIEVETVDGVTHQSIINVLTSNHG